MHHHLYPVLWNRHRDRIQVPSRILHIHHIIHGEILTDMVLLAHIVGIIPLVLMVADLDIHIIQELYQTIEM